MVGVTPDGNADTRLRHDDDWIDDPVLLMDDVDADLDEQRELAVDNIHDAKPHPPILQSVSLMGLRTAVVLMSIVEGADEIRAAPWPSDEKTLS